MIAEFVDLWFAKPHSVQNAALVTRAEPAMLDDGRPRHPDGSAPDHPGEPTSQSRVREPGAGCLVGGVVAAAQRSVRTVDHHPEPSVPVQPLLLGSADEYVMFGFFRRFPCVMEPFVYSDSDALMAAIGDRIIAPAEASVRQQRPAPRPSTA
jgi:hypothetical protein